MLVFMCFSLQTVHWDGTTFVARRKQRTLHIEFSVFLPVPRDQRLYRESSVGIHRHGSRYLAAFYNGFVKEEIGDGSAVLIHISDRQAEQLRDASASRNTEHEKPAVASFKSCIR